MKLNLGDGNIPIEGYTGLDFMSGQSVYPLDYPDGSVDVVRASHLLEHFGYMEVPKVLKEWVRVLKPGGVLKIAVPDFSKLVQLYQRDPKHPMLQSYVVGGQVDERDYHKTIFDEWRLSTLLRIAGLEDIAGWQSEIDDNASWEVSLNLQGTKVEKTWFEDLELFNIYSQFGEDAYLEEIFKKIGIKHSVCVDVGAADGLLFSNVRQWIERGWHGVLIEADEERFARLGSQFTGGQFGEGTVKALNCCVGVNGVNSLDFQLSKCDVPDDFDLLSIDIDGQDYYVWNSMLKFHPRVVVIEFNPGAHPMYIPPLGSEVQGEQAGAQALRYVAAARGYLTVAQTETNIICIRRDIIQEMEKRGEVNVNVAAREQVVALPETVNDTELIEQPNRPVNITAVISVPRLGINANWHCTIQALISLGMKIQMVEGVFWEQCLTRGIQEAIRDGADTIITIDYDSVFSVAHVQKLLQLLYDQTDYDCIVPVQIKRESNQVLFQSNGDRDFSKPLTNILTGHFGLTAFDARSFAKLPKPWFQHVPNEDGEWGDGRVDSDIFFWSQWLKAGLKIGLANEVKIGHLEFVVAWATDDLTAVRRQSITDYRKNGQPMDCGGSMTVEWKQ